MEDLEKLRKEIDQIDTQLLLLIKMRIEIVTQVGEYKKANNIAVIDKSREGKVLEKLSTQGEKLGLDPDVITKVWRTLFEISYNIEEEKK